MKLNVIFNQIYGMDLGSQNTVIWERTAGLVMQESTIAAVHAESQQLMAAGQEANHLFGRLPMDLQHRNPMSGGKIADPQLAEEIIRVFLAQSLIGPKGIWNRSKFVVCCPISASLTDRHILSTTCHNAGIRDMLLIERPLATAVGMGLDISQPKGSMIIDIGAETTEIAVISLGGIVWGETVSVGGKDFDAAILQALKEQFQISIGQQTACRIKENTGAFSDVNEHSEMFVCGKDALTGLPKTVLVDRKMVLQAISPKKEQIEKCIIKALQETPPELVADIAEQGIYLTGGTSLMEGLPLAISKLTGITIHCADQPFATAAAGAAIAGEILYQGGTLRDSVYA